MSSQPLPSISSQVFLTPSVPLPELQVAPASPASPPASPQRFPPLEVSAPIPLLLSVPPAEFSVYVDCQAPHGRSS